MTFKFYCPMCKQDDKGFRCEEMYSIEVLNNGTRVDKPEAIADTALYYCNTPGCEFQEVLFSAIPTKSD